MPPDRPSLTSTWLDVTVGPLRHALALDQNDADQIRRAAALASSCWGGMRFPWITIDSHGALMSGADELCKHADAISVIDLTRDDPQTPPADALVALGVPLTVAGWPEPWTVSPRALLDATGDTRPLVLAQANPIGSTPLELASLVGVGVLDDDELRAWEDVGRECLLVEPAVAAMSQLHRQTALGVTLVGDDPLFESLPAMQSTALVWVLPDEGTLDQVSADLVGFWNHRALQPRADAAAVITTMAMLERADVREHLRAAISTSTTTPSCVINGMALDESSLQHVAGLLGCELYEGRWSERHGLPDPDPQLTAVIDRSLLPYWFRDRYTGRANRQLTVATSPQWSAQVESPQRWRYPDAFAGHVALRMASPIITGPSVDRVAELYYGNGRWRAGGVRIVTNATREYNLSIGLPDATEVLVAAVSAAGFTFTVSDKGREIDGLLTGGAPLSLFRDPAVHAITNALTAYTSPRVARAVDGFARAVAERTMSTEDATDKVLDVIRRATPQVRTLNDLASHPHIRERGIARRDVEDAIRQMVESALLQRGFRRECTLCGLSEFISLADAMPVATCSGCGRTARYSEAAGEPVQQYRLASLLDNVAGNGGLAPLAAAAALRTGGYYVVPGALMRRGDETWDTDFLGWRGSHLLLGEAKSASGLFDPVGISLDVTRAGEVGATVFLLACPEPIETETVSAAGRAAMEAGIELHVLAGADLTSDSAPTSVYIERGDPESVS